VAKVVVGKLAAIKRIAGAAVRKKRMRDPFGKVVVLQTIEADDEDKFGRSLGHAFKTNVARARRENKLVTGKRDLAPGRR
jgi:hypothetical protein